MMAGTGATPHILFLPEWYPNPDDPQLGIFVEKHARAAALHQKVSVIYCGPFSSTGEIELIYKKHPGFTEYFCFYPSQKTKLRAYKYFINAHRECFKKLVQDEGVPDLVHLHMMYRNYIAYKKVYAAQTPRFMITEQWSGYLNGNYQRLNFLKKLQYRQAFKRAKLVTGVSQKLADALTATFAVKNGVKVLPNIAEAKSFSKAVHTGTVKILVVADLVDEIKNISGVLKAFIKAAVPGKLSLTIVGDGRDKAMLEEMANSNLDTDKTIVFTGRLNNEGVLEHMTRHDFLITNSRHETFSMVTAEALLAGLPVICSRCGGPEEFVNEQNGILVDVDDTKGLQQAIETMYTQHTSYHSQLLAQAVLQRFGLQAVGAQLQLIYRQILPQGT